MVDLDCCDGLSVKLLAFIDQEICWGREMW